MSVRLVGPYQVMGPVAVDSGATIAKDTLIQVAAGVVTALAANDNTGLAVALDSYPDAEYEGTKTHVELAILGGSTEIELPFVDAGGITQAEIGGTFSLTTAAGGTVNTAAAGTGPAFTVRRLSRDSKIGDTAGYVIGVITDAAAFAAV